MNQEATYKIHLRVDRDGQPVVDTMLGPVSSAADIRLIRGYAVGLLSDFMPEPEDERLHDLADLAFGPEDSETEPEQAPEPEPVPKIIAVEPHGGRCTNEKRAVQERLQEYRRAHGMGCWEAVARASGGKLSTDQLRDMHNGTAVLPVSVWRLAAKALDRAEAHD